MITGMKCPACGQTADVHCANPQCTWVHCAACHGLVGKYKDGPRMVPSEKGKPS